MKTYNGKILLRDTPLITDFDESDWNRNREWFGPIDRHTEPGKPFRPSEDAIDENIQNAILFLGTRSIVEIKECIAKNDADHRQTTFEPAYSHAIPVRFVKQYLKVVERRDEYDSVKQAELNRKMAFAALLISVVSLLFSIYTGLK